MKYPALMGVVDRLSDGFEVLRSQFRWERIFVYELSQALALDELHRKIMLSFMLAYFMDGDDILMARENEVTGW